MIHSTSQWVGLAFLLVVLGVFASDVLEQIRDARRDRRFQAHFRNLQDEEEL